MKQDHYSVLGVMPTAEPAEVRSAYRALMRRFHPDADPGEEAAERAREINAAYSVLSNPEKRAAYDQSLTEHRRIRFEPMPVESSAVPWRTRLGAGAALVIVLVAAGMIGFAVSPPVDLPLAGEPRRAALPAVEPATPAVASAQLPDECADARAEGLVKKELFRRAAKARPEVAALLQQVEGIAVARIKPSPSKARPGTDVSCGGWLSLDIPPELAVDGGRTNLNADIGYGLARSRGSLELDSLSGADRVVRSLASLGPASKEPDSGERIEPEEIAASSVREPRERAAVTNAATAAVKAQGTVAKRLEAGTACSSLARRAERMVCSNSNLTSLDRQLSMFYRQSWNEADERKRAALLRTRQGFNDRRDACASSNCMTTAYVSRLREISDIMAGRAQP